MNDKKRKIAYAIALHNEGFRQKIQYVRKMMIGFSKDNYKESWQMVRSYKFLAAIGQLPENIEAEVIKALGKR